MKALVLILAAVPLVAACGSFSKQKKADPPVEYKTAVVDASCTAYSPILIPMAYLSAMTPEQRNAFESALAGQILAYDRTYTSRCKAPPAQ